MTRAEGSATAGWNFITSETLRVFQWTLITSKIIQDFVSAKNLSCEICVMMISLYYLTRKKFAKPANLKILTLKLGTFYDIDILSVFISLSKIKTVGGLSTSRWPQHE